MVDRETADIFVNKQMKSEDLFNTKHGKVHYGAKELRDLFDFLYSGPPKNEKEFIDGRGWV